MRKPTPETTKAKQAKQLAKLLQRMKENGIRRKLSVEGTRKFMSRRSKLNDAITVGRSGVDQMK